MSGTGTRWSGYRWYQGVPMPETMRGQGYDRAPGVQELLATEGATDQRDDLWTTELSRTGLAVLQRSAVLRPEDTEVVITPDLVADLHDPTLVITHDYVGPDRRRSDRSAPPRRDAPGWLRRTRTVVLLTVAVVVPLTLVSVRSVPPAASEPSPTPAVAPATPKSAAGVRHHAPHVLTVANRETARAESAAQRRAVARAASARARTDARIVAARRREAHAQARARPAQAHATHSDAVGGWTRVRRRARIGRYGDDGHRWLHRDPS